MLVTAVIVFIAMGLSIAAFMISDKVAKPVIHAVSIIVWTVISYLLYNVGGYPTGNTFLPTAAMLIGLSMVIVHTTFVVIPILSYFNPKRPSYDQEQQAIRKRIASVTRRREEPW